MAHDPSFFQAYCELVLSHGRLYFYGLDHTAARLALAEAALTAASRLRPDAGETHLARARNLYWGYLDYDSALAELEIARRTLPNEADIFGLTGFIQRRRGHWENPYEAWSGRLSSTRATSLRFDSSRSVTTICGAILKNN